MFDLLKYLMSLEFLAGYRTHIACIGLVGLAAYQFSIGEYEAAYRSLGEALAFLGVRQAMAK